jgi:hypothetical protein
MRRTTRLSILVAVALAVAAPSAQALAGNLALRPGGKLWIEGKSTLHEWKSEATALTVTFEENAAAWPADAKGGEAVERFIRARGITTLECVVPVTGLKSEKSGLDKNMYKALQAPTHPEIRFKLASYEIADGATPAEMAITAKGTLTVAGVDHEIALPVRATREGDVVRMRGSTKVLMTQHKIKPPVMMMGTLRVADEVLVQFDLAVGAAQGTKGAAGAASGE